MAADSSIYAPAQALGWDVAEGGLSVVQAVRGRGGPVFTTLAEDAGALSADTQQRIRRLTAAGALPVLALSVHETFLRRLTAPFPSLDKARRVFPSLLDVQLPFPIESCACAFLQAARTADGQVSALAVAARREDIARALERVQAAGVDPVRLDHEAVALWVRSGTEVPLDRTTSRLVVYLGRDRTSYVLGRGPDLQAASGVRFGVRDFQDAARGAEALHHLNLRLTSWLRAQQGEAVQWAWTGPGAAQAAVLDAVRSALRLSEDAPSLVHQQPVTFLARAVAARAITSDPLSCNLRDGPQEHPLHQRAVARSQRRLVAWALAAALAVGAVNLSWLVFLTQRRDGLQAQVQTLAHHLAGTTRVPRGQEVLTAERARQEQAARFDAFHRALAPSALRDLERLLATAAEQQMTLDTVALRSQSLACSGTAADWERCDLLHAQLAKSGWRPELERHDAGADERVHFSLKATR